MVFKIGRGRKSSTPTYFNRNSELKCIQFFKVHQSTTNFLLRVAWVSRFTASTMYKSVAELWGNYDFRVPPEFANEELQKYGSEKKELVIFEKSAHFVQWNEPLRFYEVVNDFIDRNK